MDLQELQEAYNQVHQIDEAEGSYGKTPKATAAYGKLANERRSKPASEYSKRGEKKEKVSSAEKHMTRSTRTAADHGGKKSTKPAWHSYQRSNMTQKDRDDLRGQSEYGHVGYDPDFDGGPSAPGSKPKGKKLERQKKTGVSAESYNAYNVILSYLLDEGFASTEEKADKIILNMSEAWFENIMELNRIDEARAEEKRGFGSTGAQRQRQKSGEEGPQGRRPVTSFSGGQNPHLRGKDTSKEYRRQSSRRYVDQPGGVYGGPENQQGAGRYAKMQAKKRDQSHMSSRFD